MIAARLHLGVVLLMIPAYLGMTNVSARLPYVVNVTPSLPLGVYKVMPVTRPIRTGDRVAVCLPGPFAQIAMARSYSSRGGCASGEVALLKLVGSVGGDWIRVRTSGVSVNGYQLARTPVLSKDFAGRSLRLWHSATFRVPRGMVWLFTPCVRGWDSRYFGPVSAAAIVGLAKPVFLFPDGGARAHTCGD